MVKATLDLGGQNRLAGLTSDADLGDTTISPACTPS